MLLPPRGKPLKRSVLRVKRKLQEAQLETIVVARKKQKLHESLDDITSALGKVGIQSEQKLFNDRPEKVERQVFRLIDQKSREHFKIDQPKWDMQQSKAKRREKILAECDNARKAKLTQKRNEVPVSFDSSKGNIEEKAEDVASQVSEINYINVLQEDKELRPIHNSCINLGGDERALGFTYDYYYLDAEADASKLDVPQVLLGADWSAIYDNDSEFDGSEDDFDSEDSNAEGYYQNDYPEEVSSSEEQYNPFEDHEEPYYSDC